MVNFSKKVDLGYGEKIEPEVGISEIAGVIPEHFIKLERIAHERQLPSEYVNGGLGLIEARIPHNISLEKLVVQALGKIHYQDVERFIFATESDYDLSKAVIAIKSINKKLGLTVVPFQLKFACLAGVQALLSACEYSVAHNKPAVVIAVDRSIYNDNKAELTQGSGAIAVRIEKNPKLLALDIWHYGQYAEDIDDFRVPIRTIPFPNVSGPLTKPAYIKCILHALEDFKTKRCEFNPIINKIDYIVMHTPFPKMVVWAVAALWRYEKYREKKLLPLLKKCIDNPGLFKEFKKLIDDIRELPEFQRFFQEKIKPGLRYNSHIGNCYNASVFISLIAVLEKIETGQHLCIAGYGSGAGAITMMGRAIKKDFQSDLNHQIKTGKKLTMAQYQKWRAKTINRIQGDKINL